MTIPLDQSSVSLDNPAFNPMLINLQANILKFHGRRFAHHLFIQFKTETIEEAKRWIIYFASSKVTNAYTQLYDAGQRNADPNYDGGTLCTLSLSNYAYRTLKIKSSAMDDPIFKNGMHERSGILNDDLSKWEEEFRLPQLDMLVIVADDNADTCAACADKIISQITPFAKLIKNQRGNVLKMDETKVGIEHFGYADGISQPMYLEDEIKNQTAGRIWDDETNLDLVLKFEEDGMENCFGSYLVFRKLEQNVRDFKEAEGDNRTEDENLPDNALLPRVNDINNKGNIELPGAMIVGRFENSTPVTLSSVAGQDPHSTTVNNNFDYSDDKQGLKCPFHSHIRLVNPRKGNPKQDPDEIRSHRITRRAIPYDDHEAPYDAGLPVDKRQRFPENLIDKIPENLMHTDNQPVDKVGLLFMCYQKDIKNQFEELQGQWANTGVIDPAPPNDSVGQDSLIGQGEDATRTLPKQWGQPNKNNPFKFSGFVTMKGGEYFYTPSINYLKSL